jgi:hypothetical protein
MMNEYQYEKTGIDALIRFASMDSARIDCALAAAKACLPDKDYQIVEIMAFRVRQALEVIRTSTGSGQTAERELRRLFFAPFEKKPVTNEEPPPPLSP